MAEVTQFPQLGLLSCHPEIVKPYMQLVLLRSAICEAKIYQFSQR